MTGASDTGDSESGRPIQVWGKPGVDGGNQGVGEWVVNPDVQGHRDKLLFASVAYHLETFHRVHISKSCLPSRCPPQIALMVVQDITRQLPFTVLPTVQSGWVAMIKASGGSSPASSPAPPPPTGDKTSMSPSEQQQQQQQLGGGSRTMTSSSPSSVTPGGTVDGQPQPHPASKPNGTPLLTPAASAAAAAAAARPVNRARQLKMQEVMTEAARLRWEALEEVEKRAMIQVRPSSMV